MQHWNDSMVGGLPGETLVQIPDAPFAVAISSLRAGASVVSKGSGRSLVQFVVVCDSSGTADLSQVARGVWAAPRQPIARVRPGPLGWTSGATMRLPVERRACAALYALALAGDQNFVSPEGVAFAALGGGHGGYWGSPAAREKLRLYQTCFDPLLDTYVSRGLAHFCRVRVVRNAAGAVVDFEGEVVGYDPHPSVAPAPKAVEAPPPMIVPPPAPVPVSRSREDSRAFWAKVKISK